MLKIASTPQQDLPKMSMPRAIALAARLLLCPVSRVDRSCSNYLGERKTMAFEDFGALPATAQIGIIAFAIALVLLAIAQTLSVSSDKSKAQKASFDALRGEIQGLRHDARSSAASRPSVHGLAPPARPSRSRTGSRSIISGKQTNL